MVSGSFGPPPSAPEGTLFYDTAANRVFIKENGGWSETHHHHPNQGNYAYSYNSYNSYTKAMANTYAAPTLTAKPVIVLHTGEPGSFGDSALPPAEADFEPATKGKTHSKVTWTSAPATETITHYSVMDGSGHVLASGVLGTPTAVTTGDTLTMDFNIDISGDGPFSEALSETGVPCMWCGALYPDTEIEEHEEGCSGT
jgi:hypothetical protein